MISVRFNVKIALAAAMVLVCGLFADAQTIVRKKELAADTAAMAARIPSEKVLVNGDTVSMIIPQRNFGRYDRGLFNYLFIPKGKWAFGLTASYGELNTDDIQLLGILKDLDFSGKIYSIKPSVSYFIASNQSVGMKFNYSRGIGDLDNLAMDFSEDLNFSISDVSYYTQSYAISAFYRNYVGLGMDKRFAVFNEVDLAFSGGSSRFKRIYNEAPRDTRTVITEASLNFSPGLCVFIQDYVSFNISFGVFGLKLRKEHQTTDGVEEGSRFTSGANFRFNIFNIAFGMMVVI
ncbi:MAG: hypothetical protein K2F74_00505 [Muribaculaceae bacterium]|nr:hypothetical protein [Muribaculaceae bacterium]